MTADGRWAVCSRANQIYLYDLGTNRLVTPLADPALSGVAHRDMVQTLAFSPDGLRLASGSFQEIKLWKRQATGRAEAAPAAVATTEAVQKLLLEMKLGAAQPAALSSDGKRLAVGDAAGVVRTYDVARMKPLLDLRMDYTARRALEALQWEIARQQLEVNFQQDFIKAEETAAKALEDRQKKARDAIATAKKAIEEKKKALPAAQTEKTTVDKEVAEVQALIAKAPDGKPDAALEKKLKEAQDKQTKAVKAESDAVAAVKTAEGQASDAEAEVKIIEDAKGKAAQTIAAAKKALETANQLLVKHKVEVAKPVLPDPERDGIQSVGFSADGLRLVAVTLAGVTKEWAADTGVALVVEKDAHAWVLERTLTSPFLIDRVNVVRFSPDGKTLAAGSGEPSRSGDVTLWEAATGKLLQTWQEKHSDAVLSLDFSPDGKRLATGGADKAVRISELPGGKLVRNLEGHTHHILGLAFRADGRILASAGADNAVKIWDMLTGDRKKNIDGWDKEVTSIQFLGATDQIVTSAGDNRLRVVKDAGGEVRSLSGLPDFMFSAATSRLGDRFIGGGQDSVLRVWEAEKGTEVAQFKAE